MTTNIQSFAGDVEIPGNLQVKRLTVEDAITELGANNAGLSNVGFVLTRQANTPNVAVYYDETTSELRIGHTLKGGGDTVMEIDSANNVTMNVFGDVECNFIRADGGLLSNIVSDLQSVTTYGSSTDRTVTLSNVTTGLIVDSNVVVTGNVTAGSFIGDGSQLDGIAANFEEIIINGNVTSNTVEFRDSATSLITTGSVGIINTAPGHDLSVGANLYVQDIASNVLTVEGNVSAHKMTLGSIEITPAYSLQQVTDVGNSTSLTVEFTNTSTAFVTDKMAGIGIAPSSADVGVSGLHVDGHIRLGGAAGTDENQDLYVKSAAQLTFLANDSDLDNNYVGAVLKAGVSNVSFINVLGSATDVNSQFIALGVKNTEMMRITNGGYLQFPGAVAITPAATQPMRIGYGAGSNTQGSYGIAIGEIAGQNGQNAHSIAIGYAAGCNGQNVYSVAIGLQAGESQQDFDAVAVGHDAGRYSQNNYSVAIGTSAGRTAQSAFAVAVGVNAGNLSQGYSSVAIGNGAGLYEQKHLSVAIGVEAGLSYQSSYAVAVGYDAGYNLQGMYATAVGYRAGCLGSNAYTTNVGCFAGDTGQYLGAVAVGVDAGKYYQNTYATAVGSAAGSTGQQAYTVAVGVNAGRIQQQDSAVAIGNTTGYCQQGLASVAIGVNSGNSGQGSQCVAIGDGAGKYGQNVYSVAIGLETARDGQGEVAIAIGSNAGGRQQGGRCVAIGDYAGNCVQTSSAIAIGHIAGRTSQGENSVAIGKSAGDYSQSYNCVAIGIDCATVSQGHNSVAIGDRTAHSNQSSYATAVGFVAGHNSQGEQSSAFGYAAGSNVQGVGATALGAHAGETGQLAYAVGVGYNAGQSNQNTFTVAIGADVGQVSQNTVAIAVGYQCAQYGQQAGAIALGYRSGRTQQGMGGIAIGYQAANSSQGIETIAIGQDAGFLNQKYRCIAIGTGAGRSYQGRTQWDGDSNGRGEAIAIGTNAGFSQQGEYSVAIGYRSQEICTAGDAAQVAIGYQCGFSNQQREGIAIGFNCGHHNQQQYGVAIGASAGSIEQSAQAIAIGLVAGQSNQALEATAIGPYCHQYDSGSYATAIGPSAGRSYHGQNATAVGLAAGTINYPTEYSYETTCVGSHAGYSLPQRYSTNVGVNAGSYGAGYWSINVGTNAGYSHTSNVGDNNGNYSVNVGPQAGFIDCATFSVAIGNNAGYSNSKTRATSIGDAAGFSYAGSYSVNIGYNGGYGARNSGSAAAGRYSVNIGANAGHSNDGHFNVNVGDNAGYAVTTTSGADGHSICIGRSAGFNHAHHHTTIINATGGVVDSAGTYRCYITPIRYNTETYYLQYNGSAYDGTYGGSGEVTMSSSTPTSDDRLKFNEKFITNATDTLMKLRPQTYDKRVYLSHDFDAALQRRKYEAGLIAQEVFYDIPELRHLVEVPPTATNLQEHITSSKDPAIDPDYSNWGDQPAKLDYIQLIPYIVQSIQEIAANREKTPLTAVSQDGLIVCADETGNHLSSTVGDSSCFGVVLGDSGDVVTSGTARVWVLNSTGNLASGDLVTTSGVPGYAQKQGDAQVTNATFAKVLRPCDFAPAQIPIKRVRRTLVNTTVYVFTWKERCGDEEYETYPDENREIRQYVRYTGDGGKFYTQEEYDAMTADAKAKCQSEDVTEYYRIMRSEMLTPNEGYEAVTKQMNVEERDEHGNLVYEDTDETEPEYPVRYLDAEGGVLPTSEGAVHVAALIKCKLF